MKEFHRFTYFFVEFVRFEVGEGIEKASNDFEAEVAATMAAALNN